MKKRFSAIWLWTTLIWREIKPEEILFCWKKSWKKTFNLMRKIVKILSLKKVVKMKRLCLIWLSTTSICRENANSMSLILKIKNQKVKFLPFFTAERSVCFDFCIDAYALHCSAESTRHTVRKSKIVSKNSIYRKSKKFEFEFWAKNWWFVVIFLTLIFNMILKFGAKNCQN